MDTPARLWPLAGGAGRPEESWVREEGARQRLAALLRSCRRALAGPPAPSGHRTATSSSRSTAASRPVRLPEAIPHPVAVSLEGGVHTSDGSLLPRVNRLKLELAWRGELLTEGLPLCSRFPLRGRATNQALAALRRGAGRPWQARAKIFVPGQDPFQVSAYLLAFNGRTKAGRRAVLVHAYTTDPPISFVIPFVVHRHPGAFRTVLVTTCGDRSAPGRTWRTSRSTSLAASSIGTGFAATSTPPARCLLTSPPASSPLLAPHTPSPAVRSSPQSPFVPVALAETNGSTKLAGNCGHARHIGAAQHVMV